MIPSFSYYAINTNYINAQSYYENEEMLSEITSEWHAYKKPDTTSVRFTGQSCAFACYVYLTPCKSSVTYPHHLPYAREVSVQ
jgi:hypothetical protein